MEGMDNKKKKKWLDAQSAKGFASDNWKRFVADLHKTVMGLCCIIGMCFTVCAASCHPVVG
jgi:hypothetical protein